MSIRNLDCKIYDGYVETKQVTRKDQLLFPYSGQAGLLVDPFLLARTSNTTRETIVLDDAVRSFSSQTGKSPVLSFEDADAQNLLRVNSDLVDLALLQQSLLLGDSALPIYSAIMRNWFEAFTEVGDQHVLKSYRCAKISPGDLVSDAFRGQIAKLANSENEDEKERFGEIKKLMRAVVISSLRQNPILRKNFIRYFVLSSGNSRNYGDADLTYSILHDATCRTGQIGFIEGLLGERLSIEFSDGMSKFGNSEYDGTLENAKTCLVRNCPYDRLPVSSLSYLAIAYRLELMTGSPSEFRNARLITKPEVLYMFDWTTPRSVRSKSPSWALSAMISTGLPRPFLTNLCP